MHIVTHYTLGVLDRGIKDTSDSVWRGCAGPWHRIVLTMLSMLLLSLLWHLQSLPLELLAVRWRRFEFSEVVRMSMLVSQHPGMLGLVRAQARCSCQSIQDLDCFTTACGACNHSCRCQVANRLPTCSWNVPQQLPGDLAIRPSVHSFCAVGS
jgi:hypothetical protein